MSLSAYVSFLITFAVKTDDLLLCLRHTGCSWSICGASGMLCWFFLDGEGVAMWKTIERELVYFVHLTTHITRNCSPHTLLSQHVPRMCDPCDSYWISRLFVVSHSPLSLHPHVHQRSLFRIFGWLSNDTGPAYYSNTHTHTHRNASREGKGSEIVRALVNLQPSHQSMECQSICAGGDWWCNGLGRGWMVGF